MIFKYEPMGVEGGVRKGKVYYQDGEDYGEFYLNLREEVGEVEILSKDRDYGPALIRAFGKEFGIPVTEISSEDTAIHCGECGLRTPVNQIQCVWCGKQARSALCHKCGDDISGDEDNKCEECAR